MGLKSARTPDSTWLRLVKAALEGTLIDRENHHLFLPLLYQVATADLSPAEIAWPIRGLLRRQRNTRVLLGEVTGGLKWTDTREIAIELSEKFPDINPITVRFTDLRKWVMELPDLEVNTLEESHENALL